MNSTNDTVVSGELFRRMREAGVDEGYVPVPKKLQAHADRVLAGRDIAPMDKRLRYVARKQKIRAGNRRHEQRLREARERLVSQGLL
jgi:hypothetical protein